jgi:hypothetical protein
MDRLDRPLRNLPLTRVQKKGCQRVRPVCPLSQIRGSQHHPAEALHPLQALQACSNRLAPAHSAIDRSRYPAKAARCASTTDTRRRDRRGLEQRQPQEPRQADSMHSL